MYTAAVITVSDKGYRGEREDTSGPNLCRILKEKGFDVTYTAMVPDEAEQIMVVAVINGEKLPFAEDLKNRLVSVCGEGLKSLQININLDKTNVILGDKCKVLYGSSDCLPDAGTGNLHLRAG